MRHNLGIGFRFKNAAARLQLLAQFREIHDDAVVNDSKFIGRMGVRIVLAGLAMGRPAGMADADGAAERCLRQGNFKIFQFAFGAAARERAIFQRRDAG